MNTDLTEDELAELRNKPYYIGERMYLCNPYPEEGDPNCMDGIPECKTVSECLEHGCKRQFPPLADWLRSAPEMDEGVSDVFNEEYDRREKMASPKQIRYLEDLLKLTPDDRRLTVQVWLDSLTQRQAHFLLSKLAPPRSR
jgi:hypothetical protein